MALYQILSSARQAIVEMIVIMPPLDNVIGNPGLEFGEPGTPIALPWTAGGVVSPQTGRSFHTGANSVMLGNLPSAVTGDSFLSQTLTLPVQMTAPVLSFVYQANQLSELSGTFFAVKVQEGDIITTLFSSTTTTSGWTHRWFDLAPWAGKEITLRFLVHLPQEEALGLPS